MVNVDDKNLNDKANKDESCCEGKRNDVAKQENKKGDSCSNDQLNKDDQKEKGSTCNK